MRSCRARGTESPRPAARQRSGLNPKHHRAASFQTSGYGKRFFYGAHRRRLCAHYHFRNRRAAGVGGFRARRLEPSVYLVRSDEKMNFKFGPLLLTLALVAAAAAGGAWVGARLLQPQAYTHEDFHDRLFAELELTDPQHELMEALELRHATENDMLQAQLAAANRNLASLMEAESAYSDDIDRAIEEFHKAMLEYQKTSVRHLYEMRDILKPEQQEIFDRHVAETLREFAN